MQSLLRPLHLMRQVLHMPGARHAFVVLLLAGLASLASPAAAQPKQQPQPPVPTPADMQRAAAAVPTPAQIEAAGRASQGVPSGAPVLDLEQLARQYQRMGKDKGLPGRGDDAGGPQPRAVAGVMLFASLTMPDAALDRMIDDAIRLRAPLVLRGVLPTPGAGDNKLAMARTRERIAALLGKRRAGWQIDPMLFERFGVMVVPALVLVDPSRPVSVDCGATECQRVAFSKVTGDVSARHALATIQRDDREFAALAGNFLSLLNERTPR